jgi:two-component system, chemotaxis family, CheB/CheR fusion protein
LQQAVEPAGILLEAPATLPIVCLCGSAGALKEYMAILRGLNSDTGAAFIVIPHRSGKYVSYLAQILSGSTKMPVHEAYSGMQVKPDQVIVLPSGTEMTISGNRLEVQRRSKTFGWPNVADIFLLSLARNVTGKRFVIILSGLGCNGSAALEGFKRSGGIVLVQDPRTAEYQDMPRAAIETGCVDTMLAPPDMAAVLNTSLAGEPV